MKKYLTAIALFLLSVNTFAASTSLSDTSYEIEVLVFKNLNGEIEGEELWTNDPYQDGEQENMGNFLLGGTAREDSLLTQAVATLTEQGGYLVLAHKRWVQNAEAKSTANLLKIAETTSWNSEISGGVRFYMSRFFHLDVDLRLKEPDGRMTMNPQEANGYRIFQIAENRRIKTRETHYFDHPKFGVLVQVNPVEAKLR